MTFYEIFEKFILITTLIIAAFWFIAAAFVYASDKLSKKCNSCETEAKLKREEENIKSLQKENDRLNNKISELEKRITGRDGIISDLKKEKNDLSAENYRLSEELNNFKYEQAIYFSNKQAWLDEISKYKEDALCQIEEIIHGKVGDMSALADYATDCATAKFKPVIDYCQTLALELIDADERDEAGKFLRLRDTVKELRDKAEAWAKKYKIQTYKLACIENQYPKIIESTIGRTVEFFPDEIDEWYEEYKEAISKEKLDYISEKFNENPFLKSINSSLSAHCDPKAIFESILTGALDRAYHTPDLSIIEVKATIKSSEKNYTTTLSSCTCSAFNDWEHKKEPCKHMELLAYAVGYLQLNKELMEHMHLDSANDYAKSCKDLRETTDKLKIKKKKEKSRSSSIS